MDDAVSVKNRNENLIIITQHRPFSRFNIFIIVIFGAVDTVKEAASVILDLVGDVEVGGIYEGTVIEIKDFGAVIELLRNKEGLLHVTEITDDMKGKHPGGKLFKFPVLQLMTLSHKQVNNVLLKQTFKETWAWSMNTSK